MAVWKPVSAGETTHYTLNELCRAANENAEQIKIAEQNVMIARQEKQRARSVLIPRATAFGSYTRYKDTDVFSPNTASAGIRLNQSFTLNGRELIAYDVAKKGIETNAYALAELQFTLFDGGLRSAQIRQAEAKRNQANQRLNQARNDIILESRVAFSEYETAQKTLINLADELTSAQENYHAVQMQYQYGMADIVDMMDANTLLVQSERRISNARYALYQTIYRLFYTQGKLPAHVLE
jgi:outer membrane protein TolC